MNTESKLYVVLPAYNEPGIGRLLDRIGGALDGKFPFQIIVVEDGSKDDTAQIITGKMSEWPVSMVRHPVNQGLGPTIRDGLREAANRSKAQDIIVTLDADETQPPEIIPAMVDKLKHGSDVVIASRFRPGGRVEGLALSRRIFSLGAAGLFMLVLPIRGVRDYTCGFRVYRAGLVQQAFGYYGAGFVDQAGFQCMVDILLKLRLLKQSNGKKPRFDEIGFVLSYDRREGASKMRVARTIAATLALMLKRRFQSAEALRGQQEPQGQ